MTQVTLRKEIRNILSKYFNDDTLKDACADELLQLRAFGGITNHNLGVDWMIGAGIKSEEIARVNKVVASQKEVTDLYEQSMKYPPLTWSGELARLRDFLITKPPDEIRNFAKWSRREYSTFDPVKAKRFPLDVITFWDLAQDWAKPPEEQLTPVEAAIAELHRIEANNGNR
jgi:hypothetical protein